MTFVLTGGGHNTGIVSEPGHPRCQFQIGTRISNGPYLRSGFLADGNTIHRGILVAGMGGLACPAFWRESSATTAGYARKRIRTPSRCACGFMSAKSFWGVSKTA